MVCQEELFHLEKTRSLEIDDKLQEKIYVKLTSYSTVRINISDEEPCTQTLPQAQQTVNFTAFKQLNSTLSGANLSCFSLITILVANVGVFFSKTDENGIYS